MTDALSVGASQGMLADDVGWIVRALLSISVADEPTGVLSLAMYGHAARIVYEGDRYLRSRGLRDFGADHHRPPAGFDLALERARHATKLLEDNRKSFDDFKQEIVDHQQLHQLSLTRHLRPWVRPAAPDLGLFRLNGRVVVATIPLQLRLGLGQLSLGEELGHELHARATEIGRRLVSLARDLHLEISTDDPAALPWPTSIVATNHHSHMFLRGRYDRDFDTPSKLLALMIEAEATTTAELLPVTAASSNFACFRASLISTVHVLHSLRTLLGDTRSGARPQLRALHAFVDSDLTRDLLSAEVRAVRNTVMHYGIAPSVRLDAGATAPEIVEATQPRFTYAELKGMTEAATRTASFLLAAWRDRE